MDAGDIVNQIKDVANHRALTPENKLEEIGRLLKEQKKAKKGKGETREEPAQTGFDREG